MRNRLPIAAMAALILTLPVWASAAELFVAPSGSDNNSGSKKAPLRTIAAARDAVRTVAGREAVTVFVADGVYYLPETLVFSTEDSGAEGFPVVYRAENEGGAVLSGGSRLELEWRPYRDGIFQASTPPGMTIDQLFVNGVRQRMARYPNYDAAKPTAAYQGFAADAFSKERAAGWADPTGGYIHAMHRNRWGGYHYRITGKNDDGEVEYEGGWQNNRRMGMHKDFRMVENVFEELDAPGEWFHDAGTQTLYYQPSPGEDLAEAKVEVVRLRSLVAFEGTEQAPVKHLSLQGFVFRHAARTFMETREPMLRSDWAIYRGGAVRAEGAEDIAILDCEFDQVGGNAVFFSNYNRRVLVKGCHIHDVGASGVCFVGDPDAVRNPLFEYRQKNDLATIDREPGPKTNNYPAQGTVEDCLIHGVGRVERQPAGVQIAMAQGITVRDTSIYDCARAGINIGDGCWGGHLIEGCDVFDTVLETHDHGSFNSWGRDRYWHPDRSKSQVAVDAEPDLPLLDAEQTTVIRNSRWRCDHGWDIDLDDGSSNYAIYNNLMLRGGLKLREGFHRRAWNNVTVNNGFHPHVWYNHSGDEVYSNLFMATHRGARMPNDRAKGKRVDGNLFFVTDPAIKDQFTQFGWDVNSVAADPGFIDPANGDFRVREGSPAFDIGFENFPMDRFGVQKPALKAIARTPVIPELLPGSKFADLRYAGLDSAPTEQFWLGAKLLDLKGVEFSAYGVSKEDGGVVLAQVAATTDAARCGLAEGDLVQFLGGRRVKNVRELLAAASTLGKAPLTAGVIRDQQLREFELADCVSVEAQAAATPAGVALLPPPRASSRVTAHGRTANDPVATLIDGELGSGYGPVFPNGVASGAYKLDLGAARDVTAVRSWSFNQSGSRVVQRLTVYASDSKKDPGLDVTNRKRFTPLGSIDTSGLGVEPYHAAGLVAPIGKGLGRFRWIVWRVSPISKTDENTSFQELAVEVVD